MFLAQLRETCMTIALNRVAGTRFLVCVAAVLGSGCVDSPTSYRVEGAKTDFCVPGTLDATPSRRGHEDPVVGGFTLHGCYSAHSEACIGPDNLISAAVVAKSHFPGRRFGDLPRGPICVRALLRAGKERRRWRRGCLPFLTVATRATFSYGARVLVPPHSRRMTMS